MQLPKLGAFALFYRADGSFSAGVDSSAVEQLRSHGRLELRLACNGLHGGNQLARQPCMGRWASALVTTLLAATAAHAGPISWSIVSNVTGENGHPHINMGVEQYWIPNRDGPDFGPFNAYMIGSLAQGPYPGQYEGSQTFRIAGMGVWSLQNYPEPPTQFPVDDRFKVTLDITDNASGETGTTSFVGAGHSDGYFLSGDGVVTLWLVGDSDADLRLGDNLYRVHLDVVNALEQASIDVTVSAVEQAPEPASITIAGLGVVGAFATSRLRRRERHV